MNKICKDPFRLFFPIGCVLGLLGNSIWPLFYINPQWLGFATNTHRSIMIGGFLTAFVVGFLMTAVPRFTKTHFATKQEIYLALAALFLSQLGVLLKNESLFYTSTLLVYLFTVIFASQRFIKRKENPPSTFIFVGAGILMFLFSSLALSFDLSPTAKKLFESYFFQGGVLSLVIGIGGRLIPGIFGWTDIVQNQRKQYEQPISFQKVIPKWIYGTLLLFIISFPLEYLLNETLGRSARAIVVSTYALFYWKLYKLPNELSLLTLFLWISSLCVFIGSWVYALAPSLAIHGLHIIFIGGFSLMTFMVATRVTLAHGGGDKILEKKSSVLLISGLLISIATASRLASGIFPENYTGKLAISSSLWIAGLLVWSIFYIPKMINPKS